MASALFNSFMDDVSKGNIDGNSDTFYGMLVDATYVPNIDTHTKRSDVTGEIVGTGYTSGGAATTCTVAVDNATNRENWTFSNISWVSSTITNARGYVIYKRRGGAASADELVTYIDFGGNVSTVSGTFVASATTPLIMQNMT